MAMRGVVRAMAIIIITSSLSVTEQKKCNPYPHTHKQQLTTTSFNTHNTYALKGDVRAPSA
jgi:hypothetical protein